MNLLNQSDIEWLYQNTEVFPKSLPVEAIGSVLSVFSRLGVSGHILTFNQQGFLTLSEHNVSGFVCLRSVFAFAQKLNRLSDVEGFLELSRALNNPTEFRDTMFTIDCACYVLSNPDVDRIVLEPKLINSKKRPDFKFFTKCGDEIFCECKSLESVHRISSSGVLPMMDEVEPLLSPMIPDGLRLEIAFSSRPGHWRVNMGEQLLEVVKQMLSKRVIVDLGVVFDSKYEFRLKISKDSAPLFFQTSFCVGNKKPEDNPSVVVGRFGGTLIRGVKDNVIGTDGALKQLPSDLPSIIFLNTVNEYYAAQSIETLFLNPRLKSIIGIYSHTDKFRFHVNPKYSLQGRVSEVLCQ